MQTLYQRLDTLFKGNAPLEETLQKVCRLLHDEIKHFDWVGFYFKNGEKDELKLSAYVGASTDHTIIPYGKGICGQVAVSNQTFISQNVHKESNYLACSIETQAEIVVPIFKEGKNIGQIDIDSHTQNSITKEDEELLNYVTQKVAQLI